MKALVFERNLARFAASRVAASFGSGRGAAVSPLRLLEVDPLEPTRAGWHHVDVVLTGICGSDLQTIDGRSSRYFEDLVSFPFTPGHEVVGTLTADATDATGAPLAAGTRVVIEPVLGCLARGITPPCPSCAAGHTGTCERTAFGHLRPGLQTGFCADTGGGWSAAGLLAHSSQLHAVPDSLSDADAVTVEPMACALHAVLSAPRGAEDLIAVLGAGTLGLGVIAALRHSATTGMRPAARRVVVGARYEHQRTLAAAFGAEEVVDDDQLGRAVRLLSGSLALGPTRRRAGRLSGGADLVFDCVGSAASLKSALELVRPRGTIISVGMPGPAQVDLVSLWHREVRLVGAYAYGTEQLAGGQVARTFPLAIELAGALSTGRLVTATYPLDRYEEALRHAGAAGRRGAVKICFAPAGASRPSRKDAP